MVKITCDLTGSSFELTGSPRRIVSLMSASTETLVRLGLGNRIVGMSKYCSRYVPADLAPVVSEYLRADVEAVKALNPDIVLVTGGLQADFGRQLVKAGLPVYALALPDSAYAILDNTVRLGALMGVPVAGRELADELSLRMHALRASAPMVRPRVYAELWFGRHMRTIGSRSFIRDTLELAGADTLFAGDARGYFKPDLDAVASMRPEVVLLFSEEDDHPQDAEVLLRERGWAGRWPFRVITAGIACGKNPIHDGPTFIETAYWLRRRLFEGRD